MKQKYFLLLIAIILTIISNGQAPGHVPYSNPEQVELTPLNIFFYIIVPILILIAFLIMRRKMKKK